MFWALFVYLLVIGFIFGYASILRDYNIGKLLPPERRSRLHRLLFGPHTIPDDAVSTYFANFANYREPSLVFPHTTVPIKGIDSASKQIPHEILIQIVSHIPGEWIYVSKTWHTIVLTKTKLVKQRIWLATHYTGMYNPPNYGFGHIFLHLLRYDSQQQALAALLQAATDSRVLKELRSNYMFTEVMWTEFADPKTRTETLFRFLQSDIIHNWLLTVWCNNSPGELVHFYWRLQIAFYTKRLYLKEFLVRSLRPVPILSPTPVFHKRSETAVVSFYQNAMDDELGSVKGYMPLCVREWIYRNFRGSYKTVRCTDGTYIGMIFLVNDQGYLYNLQEGDEIVISKTL